MGRGTIVHYNASDGRGIVSDGTQQLEFLIPHWRGMDAPAVNRVVDLTLADGHVQSVTPVPDTVLRQEELARIKAQVRTQTGKLGQSVVARYGFSTLLAHAAFIAGTFTLTFVSVHFGVAFGASLQQLLGRWDSIGGGNTQALLYGACLLPAVPFFIRDRRAWLTLLTPALLLLYVFWSAHSQYSQAMEQLHAVTEPFRAFAGAFTGTPRSTDTAVEDSFLSMFHLELGAYVTAGAAAVAGWLGLQRYLTER
jgi:hypothetical protein